MNFDKFKDIIQCTLEGHEDTGVFGFCLNKECKKKVCFKCLIHLHNQHVEDCIHIDYFEMMLQNQISIFEQLCSLYKEEGSEFNLFLVYIQQQIKRIKGALILLDNQQFQDQLLSDMLFCRNSASYLKQFVTGSATISTNRKKNLINQLEQIYQKQEVGVEELTDKGDALKEQFYYQEALQCYQKAIDLNPSKIKLFVKQGICLHMLDQFYSASECFNLVLGVDPQNTLAQQMIISLQESQKEPDIDNELSQFVPFNDQEKQLSFQIFQILYEQSAVKKDTFFKEQYEIHQNSYRALNMMSCALTMTVNFEQGLRFSERALKIYPHYNKALFIKAMCLIHLTRYDEAMKIIQKYQSKFSEKNMTYFKGANTQYPQIVSQAIINLNNSQGIINKILTPQRIRYLSGLLMRAGRMTDALELLRKAEKIWPNHILLQQTMGECLLFLQRYDEAIVRYQEVIRMQMNNQNAWLKIGVALFLSGKYDDALEVCETFLAMCPKDFFLLLLQRQILMKKGIKPQNIEPPEIDESSNDIVYLINLARSLTQQEQYAPALKVVKRLAELQPHNVEFKIVQAYYQISLKYYSTALDTIENFILKDNPMDIDGLYTKGVALFNMKRYREALEVFEIVKASSPSYLEIDLCLGHCFLKQGRLNQAKTHYLKIFNNPPIMKRKSHYSYFCAKCVYFIEGPVEAVAFYNAMILDEPQNSNKELMGVIFLRSILQYQVYILRNVGRNHSVLNHMEKIFVQGPVYQKYFSILYFIKSEILLKLNKPEEAFQDIDKINLSIMWIVEVLKGNCLSKLNIQDQAQICYNNARRILGKAWTSEQYESKIERILDALLDEIENYEEHLRCWPSSVGGTNRMFPRYHNGYEDNVRMYFVYDKI